MAHVMIRSESRFGPDITPFSSFYSKTRTHDQTGPELDHGSRICFLSEIAAIGALAATSSARPARLL